MTGPGHCGIAESAANLRKTVVEAVILDEAKPDFFSPWCAILTIQGGKIVKDRTYLEPTRWPGVEAATGLVTLGGLGSPGDK